MRESIDMGSRDWYETWTMDYHEICEVQRPELKVCAAHFLNQLPLLFLELALSKVICTLM